MHLEVMLSRARSRLVLLSRLLFLSVNGLGLLIGKIHNAKTPDLYKGNVHSSFGWAITLIVVVQCIIGVVQSYAPLSFVERTSSEEHEAFIPISANAMEQHRAMQGVSQREKFRFSRDSGQGTEPESPLNDSVTLFEGEPQKPEETLSVNGDGRRSRSHSSVTSRMLLGVSRMLSSRTVTPVNLLVDMIDHLILPLGFVALVTGMVTYGGVFVRIPPFPYFKALELTILSAEATS